jgi:hypothetical protein
MPESKNNFLKAKMNKDLDDRLIPSGEYRDAQNVTISRSEGDGVGTFQNILGNELISTFDLEGIQGLSIIGQTVDEVNNQIYLFLSNYTDSSIDQLSNFNSSTLQSGGNYIIKYDINTGQSIILVQGEFLNFSKTHPILGVNLLENLLFWTDNRNQPRKINIDRAIENVNYYTTEDSISVAKFYPFKPARFWRELDRIIDISGGGVGTTIFTLAKIEGVEVGMQVLLPANYTTEAVWVTAVGPGNSFQINTPQTIADLAEVKFVSYGLKNCSEKWMATEYWGELTVVSQPAGTYDITLNHGTDPTIDDDGSMYIANVGQTTLITKVEEYRITNLSGDTITIEDEGGNPPVDLDGTNVIIYRINPNYDDEWPGDGQYLKDKFIRFSYRFKFDDGEYSLIAPFTQPAFIPLNYGSIVDDNESQAALTSVLKSFENWVDCVDLFIPSPFNNRWDTDVDSLKISELQIVCKIAGDATIKVIDDLSVERIKNYAEPANSSDPGKALEINYSYKSTKPIKVLPENELTRVYDAVPIKALSQETAGNRIIYGNFYDKHTSPLTLDYRVGVGNKADTSENRVLYNHNVKQNRTYQVGIVLADRYGRQSDVVLSTVDSLATVGLESFGANTVFSPYGDDNKFSGGGVLNWFGDQLAMYFEELIPENVNREGYPGLYSETNPLGWYSYKVVVKQQQQEYYNVYFPNVMQDNDTPSNTEYAEFYDTYKSYTSLINDNINKVPKDMSQVGPEDREFRSSVRLYPRVEPLGDKTSSTGAYSRFYNTSIKANIVDSIFDNVQFDDTGTAIEQEIDINALYKPNSALTAQISNDKSYGMDSSDVAGAGFEILGVAETAPVESVLNIYYETATSGLITDLNEEIVDGSTGPVAIKSDTFELYEDTYQYKAGALPPSTATGDVVYTLEFENYLGISILDPTATCSIVSAWSTTSGPGVELKSKFRIEPQYDVTWNPTGRFEIFTEDYFYYGKGDDYNFILDVTASGVRNNNMFVGNLPISNRQPQYRCKNSDLYDQFYKPRLIPSSLSPYNLALTTSDGDSLLPSYFPFPHTGDNDTQTDPYVTLDILSIRILGVNGAATLNTTELCELQAVALNWDSGDPPPIVPTNFPYPNTNTVPYLESKFFYNLYEWQKPSLSPPEDNWKVWTKLKDTLRYAYGLDGHWGFTNGTLNTTFLQQDLTYAIGSLTFSHLGTSAENIGLAQCISLSNSNPGQIVFDDALFWDYFGLYEDYENGSISDRVGRDVAGNIRTAEISFNLIVRDAGTSGAGLVTSLPIRIDILP